MADRELVDYFIEQTDKRFDAIESKLDELIAFRWQLIGGSAVISAIVSILIIVFGGH